MLGTIQGQLKKYEEAKKNLNKALEIKLKIFKADHLEVASSYNALANYYSNLSDFNKAIDYHEKALTIRK